MAEPEPAEDETAISEITIAARRTGLRLRRFYEVLQVVEKLASGDSEIRRRVDQIRSLESHRSKETMRPDLVGKERAVSEERHGSGASVNDRPSTPIPPPAVPATARNRAPSPRHHRRLPPRGRATRDPYT